MLDIVVPARALSGEAVKMTRLNTDRLRRETTSPHVIHEVWWKAGTKSIAQLWNEGIGRGRGELICCIHNDVEVSPGWDVCLSRTVSGSNGIAFPRVTEDEQDCAERNINPSRSTGMPPMCCFMFRRDLYNYLGGFDETYEGFHFEDTDFLLRAMKLGVPLVECEEVEVFHGRGRTRTNMVAANNRYLRQNQALYSDKHGELANGGQWVVPLPSFTRPIGVS